MQVFNLSKNINYDNFQLRGFLNTILLELWQIIYLVKIYNKIPGDYISVIMQHVDYFIAETENQAGNFQFGKTSLVDTVWKINLNFDETDTL